MTALDDAGWMPLFPHLPRTMGHENAGVIIEVGDGMEQWKVGDRVAVLAGAEVYGAEVNPETHAECGTLVQVGMGRLESTINTYPLIIKQLTIKGSKSGTREDLEGIYELMKSDQLNPPMNLITQVEIPGAIEKLRAGGVVGRFIAMYE
ncbi:D-arabinose 1-dehydrogenase-like Zn-dependent alcohol dehydrogenase [Pseudarthrobacter oxydans]|uniref:alcohol dehydrogenase catalytic domain-containing protein n=1 Tax=Pseudarthrobacter oxydans TaxID=1671 RepID=UPI0027822DDE|nr:alcohol dehydrogenase catalytic domain-containing protein [Pseudarthrobacter oxydans]MDP9981478.1 D-arabinose 1-dehydrogenase-like Zn-dependent alcohol dehydrogenase [Pseudarthrobacter oxydans]